MCFFTCSCKVERAQQQLKEQRIRVVSTVEQQAQRLRSSVAEQSQRLITAVEEGAHSLQSTAENALSTTVHLPGGKVRGFELFGVFLPFLLLFNYTILAK